MVYVLENKVVTITSNLQDIPFVKKYTLLEFNVFVFLTELATTQWELVASSVKLDQHMLLSDLGKKTIDLKMDRKAKYNTLTYIRTHTYTYLHTLLNEMSKLHNLLF